MASRLAWATLSRPGGNLNTVSGSEQSLFLSAGAFATLRTPTSPVDETPVPDQLDLRISALLLDIDGTLLDIAPAPHEVQVPAALLQTLVGLQQLTAGALALVSGRSIPDIDTIFTPLQLTAVGGHGAEVRWLVDGKVERHGVAPLADPLRARIRAIGDKPGITVEDKGYSIALHYRRAPEKRQAIHDAVEAIRAELPPNCVEVLVGKAMVEIKQAGFNKGTAIRELMRHPPFAGRRPIFVGDDVTDEAAFAVMPEFGGLAMSVGRIAPGAARRFESPADVRRWLARICKQAEPARPAK
jgi:trehalose 6-phosphate phosphatase